MNAKTETRTPRETHVPAADELKTAYEIHTLVQMIAARFTAAPSWTSVLH